MMDLLRLIMSGGILVTIVLLGVLFVWKIVKDRRSGFATKDERTQKITGKATTYALYIGSYFTLGLMFVNLINQVLFDSPAFEAGYALIASLLAYNLSAAGLRWYFDRKGDF